MTSKKVLEPQTPPTIDPARGNELLSNLAKIAVRG